MQRRWNVWIKRSSAYSSIRKIWRSGLAILSICSAGWWTTVNRTIRCRQKAEKICVFVLPVETKGRTNRFALLSVLLWTFCRKLSLIQGQFKRKERNKDESNYYSGGPGYGRHSGGCGKGRSGHGRRFPVCRKDFPVPAAWDGAKRKQ